MEHHHKFVGFTFAAIGAIIIDNACGQLYAYDTNPLRDGDKLFVGSVFILIFALVQLVTSAFLYYKSGFLQFWNFIHAGLTGAYMLVFFVLVARTVDTLVPRVYFPGLLQNCLFLIVVIVFNFIHTKLPSFEK